ncbi:TIGR03862 family flavoprotein [Rhizobium sp. C4]|uniref:TIGR03862 family flavoprotein n=1 Tax=Rhizobium sp. C4 TaxID=1349800 RepID=UPI001E41CDF3|nr:TIGR03862 family flavoprotein [Rhizobium sp. C4]MCD2174809.1 TIGR03862 family flavoprotein [Rhizobium sp. C4]
MSVAQDAAPAVEAVGVAIVGGGPAGLAAAEVLAADGFDVHVFDAMPSFGRKVLLAGKTGLNLTHAEAYASFVTRYGAVAPRLRAALDAFPPLAVIDWADGLGAACFTGSSGRVFPRVMKASPLMRAWLGRLAGLGVQFHTRHRWTGFSDGQLRFETPPGPKLVRFDACLLALGGASWPRMGSDGTWTSILAAAGVEIAPLKPANCGFDVAWSESFRDRFAGAPLKSVTATSAAGTVPGEFVISRHGIEGSLVYAHSAALRDALEKDGHAELVLDLAPGRSETRIAGDLSRLPAKVSFSNRLRKAAGIEGVKGALLREVVPDISSQSPQKIAGIIKALPLAVARARPIAEAISSAGGIRWDAVDDGYMLKGLPGVFVAGEMIDWEAPTGGYLLTACLATGRAAAVGIAARLRGARAEARSSGSPGP